MKNDRIVHCVAPTKGDVRRVMVEGDSGLMNVCHKNDKTYRGKELGYPTWSPTNNTMTWANGSKAVFFSAEDLRDLGDHRLIRCGQMNFVLGGTLKRLGTWHSLVYA